MKTENNKENKSIFFNLYSEQYIYTSQHNLLEIDVFYTPTWEEYYLELKQIENISDSELVDCYHLHSGFIGYDYTMDFQPFLVMANHWLLNGGIKNMKRCPITIDYLRTKGYAVPWLDLSVQELIDYKWIIIKTD